MSESETPTTGSPAETPAAAEPSTSTSQTSGAADAAPSAAAGFEDLRRKLLEQFSGLGAQVDSLQSKLAADLAQATAQARAVIEKEIAQVKEQYPEALGRIHELRDVGEEGWGVLRGRLDRLAGDLEKALGGFVSALSDAVKRQGSSEPDASAPTSTPSEPATPAADGATSAPGTDVASGTDAAPSTDSASQTSTDAVDKPASTD